MYEKGLSCGARRGPYLPGLLHNQIRKKDRPTQCVWRFVLSLRIKIPEQLRSRDNTHVAVILNPSFRSVLCEFEFRTAPRVETNICPQARLWWYAQGTRSRWNFRGFDNYNAGSFDLYLAWSQILHYFRDDRQICIRLTRVHLEYIFAINKLLSNTSYEIPGKEYWPSASTRAISAATGPQKWTGKKASTMSKQDN